MTQLRTQLDLATEQLEKSRLKNDECVTSNSSLRDEVMKLEKLLSEKSSEESRLLVELEASRSKLHQSESTISDYESAISQFEVECKNTKFELESVSDEKCRLYACVEAMLSDMEELREYMADGEELVIGEEAAHTPSDLEPSGKDFPDHVQSKFSELKQLTSAMTSQLRSLRSDHEQTKGHLTESQAKCSNLVMELEESQHNYAMLVLRLNSAQSSSDDHTAKIAALEAQTNNLVAQLDELKAENSEHKSSFTQLDEKLSAVSLERDTALSHATQLEADVAKLKSNCDEIKHQLTSADLVLSACTSEKQQLEQRAEDLVAEVGRCNSMLEDGREAKQRLEEELERSQQHLELMQKTAAEADSLR